ncbi:DMT family transporter [Vibrio sp.]|uniref:DMT family transporter n=1 Tax=Vibrio viridaestus TaxID=2487322 RepID=A0A3N9U939_9VIBR|nr:DMT family transporter [Vibrio viridaestus]MDC0612661.1 DMT family transporter [Vibrio sp.]RQW64736.1 DMT family transporter [Vibrio viridaestus]
MSYIYFVLALIAGAALSIQAAINSRLSDGIGGQPLVASLISFAIGSICLGVIALFFADWQQVTSYLPQQALWRWVGGALGAGIVFTSVFLAQKLGVANTMFLFIIGQLFMGMVIDSMGLIQMPVRPVYWWKYAGMTVMLAGLALFMFGEKWFSR